MTTVTATDWPAVTAGNVISLAVRLKNPVASGVLLLLITPHEFPAVIVWSSAVEVVAFPIVPNATPIAGNCTTALGRMQACKPEKTSVIVPPFERFVTVPVRV